MQKFLLNLFHRFLSFVAVGFFLGAVGCLIFRGYTFLRYGYNPEMPISTIAGNYFFEWVGLEKIVNSILGIPIEFGLAAFGILFLYWAGSVED